MRRSKIFVMTILILIVVMSLSILMFGCGIDRDIKPLKMIDKDILNSAHLEVKTNNKMTLVGDNKDVNIVFDNSDIALSRSVNELVDVLYEMTGVMASVANYASQEDININIHNMADISLDGVKNDGFKIVVTKYGVDIKGKTESASANGVYHFIEEYLGVMFLGPDDTFIPNHDKIYLDMGSKIYNPNTIWRDIYAYETADNYWAAKLKLNAIDVTSTDEEILEEILSEKDEKERQEFLDKTKEEQKIFINERRQYNEWGTWCHSMYQYLSPDEYFDEHPEYFSMKDGKRTHFNENIDAHLCLSNPKVYEIVEKSLDEKIEKHPEVKYWDFSANDNWSVKGCECENCKKMDKQAGNTGMGSLLPFVNKLADHVKEKYPDREIYISTLAYNHTLKAPTNGLKPRDNVVIKLCSMPGDQESTYLEPKNKNAREFHNQLKEWSELSDKIVVWDYVVNYSHLLIPFPNFEVQRDNQKFYIDNNLQGIFHQVSREKGGEMAKMRSYILSKLMWQGDSMDINREISKYICAYYGDASESVIAYFNKMNKELYKSSETLGLYDSNVAHHDDYLSPKNIDEYMSIIDGGMAKVKGQEMYEKRLNEIKLNLIYAKMILPKLDNTSRNELKTTFNKMCNEQGITMTREWESVKDFNKNFDGMIKGINKEKDKPIYITIGVLSGVVVLIGLTALAVILVKKKQNKN